MTGNDRPGLTMCRVWIIIAMWDAMWDEIACLCCRWHVWIAARAPE